MTAGRSMDLQSSLALMSDRRRRGKSRSRSLLQKSLACPRADGRTTTAGKRGKGEELVCKLKRKAGSD